MHIFIPGGKTESTLSISKKNRRKIIYNGTKFFWWVNPEFDEHGNMLSVNIASEDKEFIIKYFVVHSNFSTGYISIIGRHFLD